MKRLIWAAALSVLLCAILAVGNYTVNINCDRLLLSVEACKNEQNKISAQERAEILENDWVKKEPLMKFFINRNIVQEIGVHIALIRETSREPDSLDYKSACRETEILLTHAIKNQRLGF